MKSLVAVTLNVPYPVEHGQTGQSDGAADGVGAGYTLLLQFDVEVYSCSL